MIFGALSLRLAGLICFMDSCHMDWLALGDSAWLCEPGGSDAHHKLQRVLGLRAWLEHSRSREVTDIVSSFESLAVHFDPADGESVREWLRTIPNALPEAVPTSSRLIDIPVDYHDKSNEREEVAQLLGITPEDIISLHTCREYQVAALGFSPGFPYLLENSPRLRLPRKASPEHVPAGAVAIAGSQAGIYPCTSRGGWHVLGRTDACLFDPEKSEPCLLQPGDRIRFFASRNVGPYRHRPHPSFRCADIEVLDPGMFTTVQDLGRPGHRAQGLTAGGCADPVAARVVNRLVGNPDDAAVLECSGSGPVLRFDRPVTAAWLGWTEGSGKPQTFHAGDLLDLRSTMCFSRGAIAFSGGMDVPLVLGSRSTDVRACLGGTQGRPLRRGDWLPLGAAPQTYHITGAWHVGWPKPLAQLEIRFLPGLQASWFSQESRTAFQSAIHRVTSAADRTGMRLSGPQITLDHPRELVSQPVVCGSIQVPPDGVPIVLLSECQTIGGYPQIGHVVSADLPALARALPGTPVTFRQVNLDEARKAWRDLQRELSLLHTGLNLLP